MASRNRASPDSPAEARILAACRRCRTQYDLTGLVIGSRVRCRCGAEITVTEPRATVARVVRCAGCGASRRGEGGFCSFCGSKFTAVDQGWGSMCPECYCRLPNDAKFCVECGLGIHPQPLETEAAGWSCPRCKVKLQRRRVGELDLFECADCGGVWMPEEAFDEIIRRKDAARAAQEYEGAPPRRSNFRSPPGAEIRYLPCPICENPMNRRNFGRRSGVIIDSCRDHGVWLDNQELNRIIRFVEAGGLEQTRAEEAEDLKREKRRRVSAIQTAGMDALTLSTCATRKPLWGSTLAETAAIALRALFKF